MSVLPIELWRSVFQQLEDLADLASCALVSKALYFEVKAYRIQELQFVYRDFHRTHSDGLLYRHHSHISKRYMLKKSLFNLEYLKSLRIDEFTCGMKVINKFVHLEVLDINLVSYPCSKKILRLPNLKVLYVSKANSQKMVLHTPRLTKLCTTSLWNFKFIYPYSVRCIRTFYHNGKLSKFRNLESLTFTDHYKQTPGNFDNHDYDYFRRFNLRRLKKLKEIEFDYRGFYVRQSMSSLMKMVKHILSLGRPELKLFWFQVQVTHTNLLAEYKKMMANSRSLVAFQMKHYEDLKNKVEFSSHYEFNSSTSFLQTAGFDVRSEELTLKLLAKYSFERIEVTGRVNEEEHLIKLIAGSPKLWSLEFENSGLGQSFFERMANIVRLNRIPLQQLCLEKPSNKNLNFDFVFKISNLKRFETDQPLSAELIAKLLTLPFLSYLEVASGVIRS